MNKYVKDAINIISTAVKSSNPDSIFIVYGFPTDKGPMIGCITEGKTTIKQSLKLMKCLETECRERSLAIRTNLFVNLVETLAENDGKEAQ